MVHVILTVVMISLQTPYFLIVIVLLAVIYIYVQVDVKIILNNHYIIN